MNTPTSPQIKPASRRPMVAPPASRKPTPDQREDLYSQAIARSGIRLTAQRRHVLETLMETQDHPTALDVFMQVKAKVPSISLATVYNCLETLSESGLIKPVSLDRGSARYCANATPHGHFYCNQCGAVIDVPLHQPVNQSLDETWEVPPGTVVTHAEITLRGLCAPCIQDSSNTPT